MMATKISEASVADWISRLLQIAQIRRLLVFYVAALCAIFTIAAYYPGYMSPDSVEQLRQARYGVTSNTYPPLMTYIWAVTDKIIPGPAGMLILNNLVFWFSIALIAYVVVKRTWLQITWVMVAGFWPPTYGSIGTIWKDVGMQVFMLAALGAIFYAGYVRRLWPLAVAMVCVFIASGYRHNGIAGALPMTVLVVIELGSLLPTRSPQVHAFLSRNGLRPAFFTVTTLVGTGVVIAAVDFVQTFNVVDGHLGAGVMVVDLVGISVEQGRNLLPPYLNDGFTVEDLQGMYSPLHANSLGNPSIRAMLGVPHPSPKAMSFHLLSDLQMRDLQERWVKAVLDNFGSYLHNRGLTADRLLVLNGYPPWYPFVSGIDANPFGLRFRPSALNTAVMTVIRTAAFKTPLYRAWIYYVVVGVCVLMSFFWDFAYARTVQVLAASTFLYLLSLFMAAMSGDFRYNIWPLTCSYICPILLLAGRTRKLR